jgi:hypothetical protein
MEVGVQFQKAHPLNMTAMCSQNAVGVQISIRPFQCLDVANPIASLRKLFHHNTSNHMLHVSSFASCFFPALMISRCFKVAEKLVVRVLSCLPALSMPLTSAS